MARTTEVDIRDPSSAIHFHIPVAEGTVQMDCFFMTNVIEKNRLINRHPSINGKNGEEDLFGLDLKSMIGNDGEEENESH